MSDLIEAARTFAESLRGVREAAEQLPRRLHDVLDHHVTRFDRACELMALASLLQTETLGPTGTAMPLADALARVLRERGVLP